MSPERPFNNGMSETHAGPVLATTIVRVNHDTHLSAEDVAALVDGRVSPAHRRELDTHLATCSECRHEVVAASRIVESSVALGARHRRWTTAGIGLTAAAAFSLPFCRVFGLRPTSGARRKNAPRRRARRRSRQCHLLPARQRTSGTCASCGIAMTMLPIASS